MCLEAPASEISKGAASSPTVRGCPASACSMARRVGSERAWNTPSRRSEEHTSELQSLMRISYAVFCLKKKNNTKAPTESLQDSCSIQYIIYNKKYDYYLQI